MRLWNLYGQTEIAPVATVLKPEDQLRKAGSAGRAALNVETRVVDDAMNDVAVGQVGEIVHRSPQLLSGYYHDDERTRAAFEGGWFHSGDLATIDDEGYITVVDRKKDMIKSGGENVASREVEEAIYGIDGVSEVAVIGLPDPRWIEAVAAVVVAKPGHVVTEESLIAACRERLAHFKVPKRVILVEALPKNDAERNPIIVIPGVLGTVLRDTGSGRVVWGTFVGTYADPRRAEGARLVALPMQRGVSLSELRDPVAPDGVLESVTVSLLGLPVEQHAYISILRTLGAGGYRDQDLGEAGAVDYGNSHFTCFQFPYDWRRDNVENARRLHEFILEKKAYVEAELAKRYGIERDVRFDIVAHSMGGLLANYYLRYGAADLPPDGRAPAPTWAGARHVARLVMVGTPNAGALDALTDLVEGMQLAFFLPRYLPTVVGTMPSVYQLLPRTRHGAVIDAQGRRVDLFDAGTWQRFGWGLAAPDDGSLVDLLPELATPVERRAVALDHLVKSLARAKQFHAALDVPATPPPGTTLHLFSGDAVATPAIARVSEAGELSIAERAPGDARVLRSSALMDERVGRASWSPGLVTPITWSDITFVFSDHLEMTRDPSFSDNILWRLLDAPR